MFQVGRSCLTQLAGPCRGLEELQVEREEILESNFKGDVNNVDDLDRVFGYSRCPECLAGGLVSSYVLSALVSWLIL